MIVHSLQNATGDGTVTATGTPDPPRGDALVEQVLTTLRLAEAPRVHRVVTPASPVDVLREVSGYVSLLVLGQHRFDLAGQLVPGRVASAVAAGARCPVVVVPKGGSRVDRSGRPVVVALDGSAPSVPALRCAFDEAELRRTPLVVLQAARPDPDAAEPPGPEAALEATLALARQDHADVEVRTLLVAADPRAWVLDEAAVAALVVVGRPQRGLHVASWSRSVASTVLAGSACPLLVAPPDDKPEAMRPGGRRGTRVRRW
jgi:nucleotide-binding universal stress UspA family protein